MEMNLTIRGMISVKEGSYEDPDINYIADFFIVYFLGIEIARVDGYPGRNEETLIDEYEQILGNKLRKMIHLDDD